MSTRLKDDMALLTAALDHTGCPGRGTRLTACAGGPAIRSLADLVGLAAQAVLRAGSTFSADDGT
jgi:hypothetical protein